MQEGDLMRQMGQMGQPQPPVFQVSGYKNTGKTTLIGALIRRFKADRLQVGVLKRDAHRFEMDREGTDTWKHAQAGADIVAITSPHQSAWLAQQELSLEELIQRMPHVDCLLVEGFKQAPYPKLVLVRTAADLELIGTLQAVQGAALWPEAFAAGLADTLVQHSPGLPLYRVDDIPRIYSLVCRTIGLNPD